jgi:peptide/nickel transport system substrate-binding protein
VLNTRVAPFDRLAARQAINYAIDRARTVTLAGGQLEARPTCQILPPTLSGYQPHCPCTRSPSPGGSWHGPDLAEAQRLVAASGTRGMTVTVLIQPPDVANPTVRIGSYLVSVLDQIGYHASLRSTPNVYTLSHDSRKRIQISWQASRSKSITDRGTHRTRTHQPESAPPLLPLCTAERACDRL